ncbi:hypothetical protein AVEN_214823-1 [Araneus ventricosus]|uniref:Uncharacterized protein n=1 Tax=Araneus ventricosus TaxID=182803 RepID=A0A4Y2EFM4_ARAVE|nr:hypothetical protein AVEN_214823-1 [Araneus ventricosus]
MQQKQKFTRKKRRLKKPVDPVSTLRHQLQIAAPIADCCTNCRLQHHAAAPIVPTASKNGNGIYAEAGPLTI